MKHKFTEIHQTLLSHLSPLTLPNGILFSVTFKLLNTVSMDQEKKNRSGSQSSEGSKTENVSDRRQKSQPGAPTGGSQRHERDDSSRGADRNTTKKGENAV
jgi:hypothetical protein